MTYLHEHWEDALARRLLGKVARASGDPTRVIKAGLWVRSEVGWGRIDRIEDADGQRVEDMIRGDQTYRLFVTLRPDIHPEPVVFDLGKMVVTFEEPGEVWTCTREGCSGCSSHDYGLIKDAHNNAAHDGVAPSFRKEKFGFRSIRSLHYSSRKPRTTLA